MNERAWPRRAASWTIVGLASLAPLACGGSSDDAGDDGMQATSTGDTGANDAPPGTDGDPPATGAADGTGDDAPDPDTGTVDDTGEPMDPMWPGGYLGLCHEAPPAGAEMPPPVPAYSGGECPTLVNGVNQFVSAGNAREFILVAPTDVQPGEKLPLVFLWHWLGGDAEGFIDKGDVQNAANELRFVAIAPENKGDLVFRWPFTALEPEARVQEELMFFDDMYACAAANYDIEPSCVSSVGVSAGALWTSQLASDRGVYLSSFVSLSGGTGGIVKSWRGSQHVMPAFVLWGGPSDTCIAVNFEQTSHDLEQGLTADGHPIVECIHNCAHSEPPFDQPEGMTPYAPMWQFVLDHPYWLDDGDTPWSAGLPDNAPPWCGMGPGSSEIRVGECGPSAC